MVVDAGAGHDADRGVRGRADIHLSLAPIEEYHLTLKSGCRIEDLRLEKWDSLAKAIVMSTSVAARIVALRDRAAQELDAPATVLLRADLVA